MFRGWMTVMMGSAMLAGVACGGSSPGGSGGSSPGGSGGHASEASSSSVTGTGTGGSGGGTGVTCKVACSQVEDLVLAYGCTKSSEDCACAPECAEALAAWMACTPKGSTECSCNAAGELDCADTLCKAEREAFQTCQYGN